MKKQICMALALSMVMTTGSAALVANAAEEKTTVVFWNSWTGGDGDTLEALVNKFNEESEDVYVDMTRTTSFSDMLQTSLPTGEAADLILLSTNEINRYGSYLRDMGDIWENTSLKEEDFSPAYMSMCYNDDTLYGIPFQISTYMMYYNKDLFEQAGVEKVPTTFDEWTAAAEAVSALSTDDNPIYGSGLFYCYNGQNQSVIQRFGTGYLIEGDEENGFKANLLENQAFADSMIWMKNLYDKGYNPQEQDIDSMMAAGQIGVMTNGGWLKGALDASGVNYGVAMLPTVTGEDQKEYALADMASFMLTTSATDEEAAAAQKFIEWWMTGSGLAACETTNDVDYSNVTPNAEWSISMCYLNAYLPTSNSEEYQAVQILADLTPSETAQVQMFTAPGNLAYSDAASCQTDFVQDWLFNGPTDPTYDDVQEFFVNYQADLEDYISEYY